MGTPDFFLDLLSLAGYIKARFSKCASAQTSFL